MRGTGKEHFETVTYGVHDGASMRASNTYITELDGVELPIPLSRHMIVSRHLDAPGVLLILLSALFSKGVNITDLQLAKRGTTGYALLGIDSAPSDLPALLKTLGPTYYEARLLSLAPEVDTE
ncbi:hypothetical protein CALK_1089 [Chitinivibrio alkaliphilus ACht1]|uniref:ACT domain-containing protein n=1 Tax=Chitinivibrio alkaliphilus ACht1 TaxID=1313304 RepID=U7D5U9_9BACT|nr:hypothetical protein CALK_1089 [Chitinivibrio alkaliphilus ACht1]